MPATFRPHFIFTASILGLWLFYCLTCTGTSGDSRWVVPAAESLWQEGNLDVDEYLKKSADFSDSRLESVGDRHYSIFPMGTVLVAAPFVGAGNLALQVATAISPQFRQQLLAHLPPGETEVRLSAFYWRVEQIIASFLMALAAGLFYLAARERWGNFPALLSAAIFAFCTPVWSIGATALWQHGPSLLLLILALWIVQRPEHSKLQLLLLGVILGFSFVVRPTNAIPVIFFGLYLLWCERSRVLCYVAGGAAVAVPFVAYNFHVYGALLPPYYAAGRVGGHILLGEALLGNLFSPARGLFVYSPIYLFSLAGVFLGLRHKACRHLLLLLSSTVATHWVLISAFPHWWGGVSYGPRLFSDMTPFLVWMSLPALQAMCPKRSEPVPDSSGSESGASSLPGRRHFKILFSFALLMSAYMHFWGAHRLEAWQWNLTPTHIDQAPERLWDWHDPPFLR